MSDSRDRYYLSELQETAKKYPASLCVRNAIIHLEKRLGLPLSRESVDPIAFVDACQRKSEEEKKGR